MEIDRLILNEKDEVTILMSTYNGERYLQEQIESILCQTYTNFKLLIRDDGSVDDTKKILQQYDDDRIKIFQGDNYGVTLSFFELLNVAPLSDYYAFADQDDVWKEDKIEEAIKKIDTFKNVPCLYFCNQTFIWPDGKWMGERYDDSFETPGIIDSLLNNDINGCTMVFNYELLKVAQKKRFSQDAIVLRYHDAYLAEIAAIYGKIVFDNRSFMGFRRHDNNSTDGRTSQQIRDSRTLVDYIKLLFEPHTKDISIWAKEIIRTCGSELDDPTYRIIKCIAEYNNSTKKKCELLRNKELLSYWRGKRIAFYFKVIFGWL